jgi:hypothetical protein
MYFIQIHIQQYVRHYEFLSDLAVGRLEVECLVSQALLQCFWEVHYAEC